MTAWLILDLITVTTLADQPTKETFVADLDRTTSVDCVYRTKCA